MQWFKIPAKTYFEPNAIKYLRDMYGIERAVIVCDKVMEQLGVVDKIIDQLRARSNRVTFRIIDYVEPEPSVETVERGATMMREEFEPDTIIAVGGGSPMDASKIMWLLYEHPEISFSDVREKFFDIRKRAFKIPPLGKKAKLVCIPTSSGTGSEVTPFAVITDHKTGYKYPITDYALTPSVAIVDPEIAKNLGVNPGKTPEEGVENLAKAVEDYRDNKLGMNKSFQECGVDEDYFWSILDQIGMRAYEDQCAPANPRIPQIEDMKDIAIAAYYGVSQAEGHKLRVQRQGEAATEEASERA